MNKDEHKEEKKPQQAIPKKSLAVEFWVGLFFMIGIACFAYLAVNLAGIRFFNTGFYQVIAQFDNISGLENGASVEIAGVHIGDVSAIKLDGVAAEVTMDIRDGVTIREDDIAAIRTKGIIGDRYVKIIPGASDDTVKGGEDLRETESAVEFEEIIGKLIHKLE